MKNPRFTKPLHVGLPNIGDRAQLFARISEALDRRWLTNAGPLVQQFEKKVAEFAGVEYCVAFCNGTIALESLVAALELKGEVILPSFTFVAAGHALLSSGLTPVFCDIDPATHCLDPALIPGLITPRTSAILGTHLWGNPCAVDALAEIADKHHLRLIFDAAHAFACSSGDRPIGSFGDAEMFSFHATKFINTFEGGAITTSSGELARKLQLTRNFGFAGYDEVVAWGTNGKMNEISAAMGLTGLEAIGSILEGNRRAFECYERNLQSLRGIRLHRVSSANRQNWQYAVVEVDAAICGLTRDEIQEFLHSHNVLARRYFFPGVHQMEPYRSLYPNHHKHLPVTDSLCQRVLVLPTGASLSDCEIAGVIELLRELVADPDAARQRCLSLKQV